MHFFLLGLTFFIYAAPVWARWSGPEITTSVDMQYASEKIKITGFHEGYDWNKDLELKKKNPNVAPRIIARQEIEAGNICLRQIKIDMDALQARGAVKDLCKTGVAHRRDIAAILGYVLDSPAKKKESCELVLEAKAIGDSVVYDLVLYLRTQTGHYELDKNERIRIALPTVTGSSWKALFEQKLCSFPKKSTLQAFQAQFAVAKASAVREKDLYQCRLSYLGQKEQLTRMTTRLQHSSLSDWVKEFQNKLDPVGATGSPDRFSSAAECKSALADLIAKTASVRDVAVGLEKKYGANILDSEDAAPAGGGTWSGAAR